MILHIIKKTEWEVVSGQDYYYAASLEPEGFIHCCYVEQLKTVADCYYKGQSDLCLLVMEESKLTSQLKLESSVTGEAPYPHIYGPINKEAVIEVIELPCGEDGYFSVPVAIHEILEKLSSELIFKDLAFEEIDLIHGLWEMNRSYHENIATNFSHLYTDLNFEDRMAFFNRIDSENLKVTLVYAKDQPIAYCLSYIENGKGECASLHVDHAFRGKKVGQELVKRHLEWFEHRNCSEVEVAVACENMRTIAFYESMGFKPNTIHMQKI